MKVRLRLIELQLGNEKQQDHLAEEAFGELANHPEVHGLMGSEAPDDVITPSERSLVVESVDREAARSALGSALRAVHAAHDIRWGYPAKHRTNALDQYLSITDEQMVAEEIVETDELG